MTNDLPNIITVNQQKGGVGKSTIVKILTNYLALDKDRKVLNIDGDYSGYLTHLYGVFDAEGHIGELFKLHNVKGENEHKPNIKFHKIHKNIDLINYDSKLNEKEKKLLGEDQISFIMLKWMFDNEEKLSEYDYIIIDTHNDFELFTKNAITMSDIVLAPLDPAEDEEFVTTRMEYEFNNLEKNLVEPISKNSYVNANLYTIGNKVKHNWAEDQKFLNILEQRDDYLTYFPNKSLIVQASKEVKTMKEIIGDQMSKHKEFYENYQSIMKKIEDVINK